VAEDGGLAIPPMDVGALFMSQATTIQHVSEVLNYKTFSFVPFPSGAKNIDPFFVKERGAYIALSYLIFSHSSGIFP
jgi:hypothetical protein